jgi:enamine deaminase RidA (YjgF/YER057c/UK114 family)
MTVAERLAQLGLSLPAPLPRRGRFRPVVVRGDLAFTSGALGTFDDPLRVAHPGQVGIEVSVDDAKQSARLALLATIANLDDALGGLERVDSFVHVTGYVNADPSFGRVHHVVGAANDLVAELFGDDRLAARTAVGVATLPERASVVVDAVVALAPADLTVGSR